ncbi:permease [Streptomyces sp. P38-E01]|uniref:Permease n=1 Tax=Streptomyces tardus TaxID=2780544 RepID=A0A949JL76_9ACTN|nr:permease [Streptomyces tardus]MBU7600823.1 permease [Streptomyces tardus]
MSDGTARGGTARGGAARGGTARGGAAPVRAMSRPVLVGGAVAGCAAGAALLTPQAFGTWQTVAVSLCLQAVPFLLLGTLLSAAVAVFLPPSFFRRALPRRPALAVPAAGASGLLLPGCECASVPVASALIRQGVPQSAAFTFLLAAPAVNPVVLVSTAVAFPDTPEMVAARLLASLGAAILMGWLWLFRGRERWLTARPAPSCAAAAGGGAAVRLEAFRQAFLHDFLHAGGYLVAGAMAAATFQVAVDRAVLDTVSASVWAAVLLLAGLAILLSVCSEADAFVAASMTAFPATAQLAFMVVGPMVDVKLIALQSGTFGRSFAVRFGAATAVVAVGWASAVGWWLL